MIDLLKFNKPEQFPKDEILNDRDRLVRSWMSVEVTDKQGDIVPVDQLKKVLNTWFKRGATMMDQHTNRPIGRGLRWQESVHEETKKPGIILDYQIFDDYSIDNQIWEDIKEGKRTGLSIGGRATEKPAMKEDDYTGSMGKYLQGLELYEVSPVDTPANQFGTNIAVNYLAKSMKDMSPQEMRDQLLKDLTKGIAGEIQKPFAGFENFDACVTAQQEKGHSEDSAKRICGFIMHQTEKKFMENKSEEIKKPFGEYKDFEDCVRANQDKDSPEAYCASVEHQITGKWPSEKSEYGPGGHKRDKTGPHGSGEGPGRGTAECRDDVDKGRVYLSPGQKPPEGASIRQGPHGGRYYEEKPGKKPGAPKEPAGKRPETKPHAETARAIREGRGKAFDIASEEILDGAESPDAVYHKLKTNGTLSKYFALPDKMLREIAEQAWKDEESIARLHPEASPLGEKKPEKKPNYAESKYHGKDPALKDVNPTKDLDPIEAREYKTYRGKGQDHGQALQTIINTVEGDTSQLSDKLREIAEAQEPGKESEKKPSEGTFKPGESVDIQTAEKLIPAKIISHSKGKYKVRITRSGMGYKQGDETEIDEKELIGKSLNKRWPIEFVKAVSQLQKSAEPWPADFIKACDKPKSLNS